MDSLIYESGLFIPEPATELELEPCPICKRTFVPATLEKHIGICQKMQTNKRKIFDSSQKRREGTELEKYMPPPPQLSTLGSIRSRFSPPKQLTTKLVELKGASSPLGHLTLGRQGRSNSTSSQGTIGEYVRKRSLSKEPASDRCPYCDRNFGIRAYDRHVEWCKEKAILKSHGAQPAKDVVGKERLNARIGYKAPSLSRTRRGTTRDKYSPFDDVFMKSFVHNNSKSRSEAGRSLSNSMTSSVISDSGFSDKYDPFMSAKRQMEELFSPHHSKESTPLRQMATTATSGRSTPIVARKPIGKASTPTATRINANDTTSFRRTMSLRLPKRTSPKPVTKPMPTTIQMGITDDGPISTNFVKPEEFDEMPVRSVYSTLPTNPRFSPTAAVLRNPETIPNRKNLKLNLTKINLPSIDFPISKTDSLATFLNYEKHLGLSAFSEKDVKDTNNILNKQSQSMKMVAELDDPSDVEQDQENEENNLGSFEKLEEIAMKSSTPRTSSSFLHERGPPIKPSAKIVLSPIDMNKVNEKMKQLELEFEATCHEDKIDPKLINTCDNLSISLSKLSENTSSTGSQETTKPSPMPGGLSHSNSERKVQLKRQIKLEKDHILYDKTPPAASADALANESDPFSGEYDRQLRQAEEDEKQARRVPEREKYFDDFDFEEFINTFEDDEQNPIFKGYKEMLRSNSKLDQDDDEDVENSNSEGAEDDDDVDDAYYTGTNNDGESCNRGYSKEKNGFDDDQPKTSTPAANSSDFIFSTDSSYGSLTRQSTPEKEDAAMIRGGVAVTRTCSNQSIASAKFSRFCYECGSEFIVPKAKFCMECGVKRVILE